MNRSYSHSHKSSAFFAVGCAIGAAAVLLGQILDRSQKEQPLKSAGRVRARKKPSSHLRLAASNGKILPCLKLVQLDSPA